MKISLYIIILLVFSNSMFSQNTNSIEKLCEKYNESTPGCAIGVVKDGELIYQKGFGLSCLDYSVYNDINTKFFIGSITKQFTGACIAYLILENKVNPNDDIRKYIPKFPFYGDTIRVKNLLHHTSGIKNYEVAMDLSGIGFENYFNNFNYLLKLISKQNKLDFKPDTKFSYSNSNYTLLAEIVKRVSGKPIEIFAKEKIFQPIGMNNTFYWINPKKIIKDRATGYKPLINNKYEISHPHSIPFGSGNIISTVDDLCKWGTFLSKQYHDNTDFIKIFTETCNTKDTDYKSAEYACGIDILHYRGILRYEHDGGMLGFASKITIYPEYNISIIVLGNTSNVPINAITSLLSDFYLKDKFIQGSDYKLLPKNKVANNTPKYKIITTDIADLKRYEAYYKFGKGYIAQVKATAQGLCIYECWNNSKYIVYPISDTSFVDTTNNIQFNFYDFKNNKPNEMKLSNNNGSKDRAVRINIEPSIKKLENNLNGFYFNDDLNIVYHIYSEQGNFWLRIGNKMPLRLIVENKALMSFFGYEAKIIYNDSNQITGFNILKSNNLFTKISKNL